MNQRYPEKGSKIDEELQAEVEVDETTLANFDLDELKERTKKISAMLKTEGRNDKEKQALFKERTYKFFKEKHNIDLEKFCFPRPDLSYASNIKFEQQSLIVYGVDFMSPKKLYSYFRYFEPRSIDWINDSTCKVTFKFCSGAKRAVLQNINTSWGRFNRVQKGMWYQLNPYYILGFQRQLQARIATNLDKTVSQLTDSQYPKFQKARQQFQQQIQQISKHPLNQCYQNFKSINSKKTRNLFMNKLKNSHENTKEIFPISSIQQQLQILDADQLSLLDCIRCLQIESTNSSPIQSLFLD